jgi:hypothetical protein
MIEHRTDTPVRVPIGFAPDTGGLASAHARQMGWVLTETGRKEADEPNPEASASCNERIAADSGSTQISAAAAEPQSISELKPPAAIVKVEQRPAPKVFVVKSEFARAMKPEQKRGKKVA